MTKKYIYFCNNFLWCCLLTAALNIDDGSVGHCEERYVVYAGEYRRSLETTLLRSYIQADGLQWASRWELLRELFIRMTHGSRFSGWFQPLVFKCKNIFCSNVVNWGGSSHRKNIWIFVNYRGTIRHFVTLQFVEATFSSKT